MSYCCSECSFSSQFESALAMHRQLHHAATAEWGAPHKIVNTTQEKSKTVPRVDADRLGFEDDRRFISKLSRTSSATRLLGRLRARICRSKTLFSHPEEAAEQELRSPSECSSKALKCQTPSCSPSREPCREPETFACHLCGFDADRITVLDRHLLTDHKIGLENLLKLVMAKTKDGLSEEVAASTIYGIRTPYYKPPDEIIEEGEFVIETVTPKIKILKHMGINTDLKGSDIEKLKFNIPIEDDDDTITDLNTDNDKRELLAKMNTLNECMCKFVDSSNLLKKVLNKEFDQKTCRSERPNDSPVFDLGLGDQGQETPRNWERGERAHSEKLERCRSKYGESRSGSEKVKNTSESFYF